MTEMQRAEAPVEVSHRHFVQLEIERIDRA
jgi:hypothetical protein